MLGKVRYWWLFVFCASFILSLLYRKFHCNTVLSVCLSVCLSFSLCVVMVFARRERSVMALISVTSPAHNTTATCETPTQHNYMYMYIAIGYRMVTMKGTQR